MKDHLPSYLCLYESGELTKRADAAFASMASCTLCPHQCGVNRLAGQQGRCRSSALPTVASWTLHIWEEPPISGTRGSGTIFFSGCTGRCRFCQNYPISQLGVGQQVTVDRLAEMMLELQQKGAHNINFVTPSHYVHAILAALPKAIEGGLQLPLLYNSSGYERVETLALLEKVIDIWLPDAKYVDDHIARRLSGFDRYVEYNQAALLEMFRQVGEDLLVDEEGIAKQGMIVRHMVLPCGLAGTAGVLDWIARHLSAQVHVSLMAQYFAAYKCVDDPDLGRKITEQEYDAALAALDAAGLENGWVQDLDGV